jgi:serine/threonine protein kinase
MPGVEMKNGRIAMGVVPGKEMGQDANINTRYGPNKISAPDVYWKAMADLHRLGVAHNDAHIDNILIDNKGKGRWVDLGAAQASPKAALAEAMGIFPTIKGAEATRVSGAAGQGNWQSRKWDGTGVKNAELAKSTGGETWENFKQKHPVASKVWDNRVFAFDEMRKMGLTNNDISSIIDHGIRSTPESYSKSEAFNKITDTQAQKILNTLYEGI